MVTSLLADRAVVDQDDLVGVHHRIEPVRDHHQGAALGESRQRLLELHFILGIGGRRGFIEHQHRRIKQYRAGDTHTLQLTAGKLHILTNHRVVTPRQGEDALVNIRGAGGLFDFLLAGRGAAQGDVVAQAGMDKAHFLQHKTDAPVQLRALDLPEVDAAQGDAPFTRIKEAQQQAGQGRLAGAGSTDNRRHRARLEGEADILEHRGLAVVAIAELLDTNFGIVRQRRRGARQGFQHRCLQQRMHTLGSAGGIVQVVGDVAQQQQGCADARRHQGERQHLDRSDPAQAHPQRAKRQHHAEYRHRGDHRVGVGHRTDQRPGEVVKRVSEAIDRLAVAAMGLAFDTESLDHGNAVDELNHCVVDPCHAGAK